jgi:hypothetical protein
MEYELYTYCTYMGCFIIILILAYHFLGEEQHPAAKAAFENHSESATN